MNEEMTDYRKAVTYLYSLQKFGIKFGLSKTSNLLKAFGNPHIGQKYIHVAGTDIVRDGMGRFLVLEDNSRTPSGVSYVVENRHLLQRAFPDIMEGFAIEPVSDYGVQLANRLAEVAPPVGTEPQIVLLSPGVFNSAYFEHIFLAREMGVPLVEGGDLFVEDDRVCVILGDNIFSDEIGPALQRFARQPEGGRIFLKEVEHANRFGVAEVDGARVLGIEEKPRVPKSRHAVTGRIEGPALSKIEGVALLHYQTTG